MNVNPPNDLGGDAGLGGQKDWIATPPPRQGAMTSIGQSLYAWYDAPDLSGERCGCQLSFDFARIRATP